MIPPRHVIAQTNFLGYREALASEPEGTVLWLAAQTDAPGKHPNGAVAGTSELILPITLDTYDETILELARRLDAADSRGCKRLSLPEALYRIKPSGEKGTEVGSYKRNDPVLPPDFRIFWADIDVAGDDHTDKPGQRYPLPTALGDIEPFWAPQGSGAAIAEAIGGSTGDFPAESVVVDTGNGGYQVYTRFARDTRTDEGDLVPGVTEDDYAAYLMRVEERMLRDLDDSVVRRHGMLRVWGHNRLGAGRVNPSVQNAFDARREVASSAKLAAKPSHWGGAEATRYKARLDTVQQAAEVRREARAASAEARAKGAGDTPRDRMSQAYPASLMAEVLHGAEVAGDKIRFRSDFDTEIGTFESGAEYVSTFSPTSAATMGLTLKPDTGCATGTSYALLKAVAGWQVAWRIARAFDSRFNELSVWLDANRDDLAGAAKKLAVPRPKRRTWEDLVAEFNELVTVEALGADPVRFATASDYVLWAARGSKAQAIADMKGLMS